MTPDHYATLGVPATAKTAEIRAAYLALMREYHPDRNRDPAAVERAQAVIAAFKVLGDFDRRNHYDWGRRREREAAEAEAAAVAAKRPRRIRAGAVGAGVIGLAAVATWVLMPAPGPKSVTTEPKVAEARALPVAKAKPRREVKRVAVAAPAKAKAENNQPARKVEPRAAPERIAKAEPVRVPVTAKPEVERAPVVRLAAVKAPEPRAVPQAALPPPLLPARVAARPVRPAAKPAPATSGDLASLDQFVMAFYGQSWRYGDAPKRAALEQSRASFVARRGGCAGDSCKRDAYLKLMRDVSAIVESGQPKAP